MGYHATYRNAHHLGQQNELRLNILQFNHNVCQSSTELAINRFGMHCGIDSPPFYGPIVPCAAFLGKRKQKPHFRLPKRIPYNIQNNIQAFIFLILYILTRKLLCTGEGSPALHQDYRAPFVNCTSLFVLSCSAILT